MRRLRGLFGRDRYTYVSVEAFGPDRDALRPIHGTEAPAFLSSAKDMDSAYDYLTSDDQCGCRTRGVWIKVQPDSD